MTYIVTGERAGMVEGVILIETQNMATVENLVMGALQDGFNVEVEKVPNK